MSDGKMCRKPVSVELHVCLLCMLMLLMVFSTGSEGMGWGEKDAMERHY